ncbi:MAG TPA: hypothetical protein VLY85_00225 [Thermoplasmata archaeon]|nr:hypothetical protein [Thermoplasmata archaeon]
MTPPYREYRREAYPRDPFDRGPRRPGPRPAPRKRSNAAVPAAVAVLLLGLVVGHYSILVPALLGIALLYVAVSFVSSRLNPFAIGFYLTVKPSWAAIGAVALIGIVLLATSYAYYVSGFGPIAPGIPRLP